MLGVIASRHRQTQETRLVSTWNVATNNELVTLPISKLYEIDWGDGTTTTDQTSHTYANSGTYQIKIAGVVDDWGNWNGASDPGRDKLISVDNISDGFSIFNTRETFAYCDNLVSVSNGTINLLSSSFYLFRETPSLLSLNDVTINFANANNTSMQGVFFNSPLVELNNVLFTNTQNSITALYLFSGATNINYDISYFDFRNMVRVDLIMSGKSSADYDYHYYDNLLIKWDKDPSEGGLDFNKLLILTTDFGTIKRSSASQTAYDSLVSKGLIITDGGLI